MRKTQKELLTVFLFILVEVAFLGFLGLEISKKASNLFEKRHKLLALSQKEENVLELRRSYSKIKDKIPLINRALPNRNELVGFFTSLEEKAESFGVTLKISFEKDAVETVGNSKITTLTFQMNGSFSQIITFLKSLEKMPQILYLTDISIKSPDGLEEEIFAKAVVRIYLDPEFQ